MFFHKAVGENPIRVTFLFGPEGSFGLIDRKPENALALAYSAETRSRSAVAGRRSSLATEGAERLSREHWRVRQAVRLRDCLDRQLPIARIDPTEQSWLFVARTLQASIGE